MTPQLFSKLKVHQCVELRGPKAQPNCGIIAHISFVSDEYIRVQWNEKALADSTFSLAFPATYRNLFLRS